MEQWGHMWTKELKYTLCYDLKYFLNKIIYRWYLTPNKLFRMYKNIPNTCWKCKEQEGTFSHAWWTCKKSKKLATNT